MSINQSELDKYLADLLQIHDYQDYGPNGLQIEGKKEIKKIAFAVSATIESIKEAIKLKADALVVHHGLFWRYQGPKTITGVFAKRIKPLIENNINLFAYHLPLDAHLEIGNAAEVAKLINLTKLIPFGDYKGMPLGVKGTFAKPIKPLALKKLLKEKLNHEIILGSPDENAELKTMGIITGGANNEWTAALNERLDSYLTGEISEYNWHDSIEAGIHYFAGGHHATERFGVQALADCIKKEFSKKELSTVFIDSPNPA